MSDKAIKTLAEVVGLLILGLIGGFLALWAGLPMPFLLGSLVATACYAIPAANYFGQTTRFPLGLRKIFIAVIGVMIGATFSRELVSVIPSLWLSLSAMVLFVIVAQAIGYWIFRVIGRNTPVTSWYAAMPGGLVEAVSLGEQAGADVRILSLQHFARIVLVVMIVPMLFYLWSGEVVGSSAGQAFSTQPYDIQDLAIIAVLVPVGTFVGSKLRFPAPHMMGPLIISAIVHASGLTQTVSPTWLLGLAQLVVGVGLGSQFAGSTVRQLLRGFGLGVLYVGIMLTLSLAFALALHEAMPISTQTLFISFAPGGVTEMGLIALSLGVSPVIVAVHHLFRIFLTVGAAGFILKKVS